jgi:His/Glu/Gln/Arg/opine family amino acid ABC transporter permease subunit
MAAVLSLSITIGAYGLGLLIGFSTGWVRAAERPVSQVLHESRRARARALGVALLTRVLGRGADFFVELIRGTPLLVQVLFVWSAVLLVLPSSVDLPTKSIVAGLIAMTMNTGAYQSEIFRAGILAVPRGQLEAARAVGLTSLGAMRHIVLPQTLRLVAPPLTNEFISLFKASSLLFLIGVAEVTSVSRSLSNFNPRIFEVFLITTALYLLLTVPLSRAASLIEKRFRIPGLGLALPPT